MFSCKSFKCEVKNLNKTTSEMKLVPISKLVPYANNARMHSPEQINKLRGSLREFGFVSPVIIDKDYGILAGHGRRAWRMYRAFSWII